MAPTSGPPLLQVREVHQSFGELVVLRDVSFAVPAGQAVGIVGPNGAGKSTLLDVVGGTRRPGSGQVLIDGTDVTRRAAADRARLGVGRSFQIPRPFSGLTVFENVLVAATGAGRGRGSRAAATEALERTGMTRVANTRAGAMPLLGRKRLELARALATGPRLLLLDEIAGGLTEAEADELVQEIQRVKAGGVTIIWIEHVVRALVQVVDRLVCLASGTVLVDGAPDEVLRSPEVLEVYLGRSAA